MRAAAAAVRDSSMSRNNNNRGSGSSSNGGGGPGAERVTATGAELARQILGSRMPSDAARSFASGSASSHASSSHTSGRGLLAISRRRQTQAESGSGSGNDDRRKDPPGRFPSYIAVVPWYIIEPDSLLHQVKSVLGKLLVVYVAVILPVSLGFVDDLQPVNGTIFVLNVITDVFFIVDLLTEFLVAYEEDGQLVCDLELIAQRYLRTWFMFDLVASIPTSLLEGTLVGTARVTRLARLPRMLKLARVLRLMKSLYTDGAVGKQIITGIVSVLAMCLGVYIALHWFACGWHAMAFVGHHDTNWLEANGIDDQSFSKRYIVSVYWVVKTLSTVGYGNIHPTNRDEMIYASIFMVFGALCYATLVGATTSALAELNRTRRLYAKYNAQLSSLFASGQVESSLSAMLQHAVAKQLRHSGLGKGDSVDETVVSRLPPTLRMETLITIHADAIQALPVLDLQRYPKFVSEFVHALKGQHTIAAWDLIMAHRSVSTEVFFITEGDAYVVSRGKRLVRIQPGDMCGLLGCLFAAPREYSVRVGDSGCMAYSLSAAKVQHFYREFRKPMQYMQVVAEQQAAAVVAAKEELLSGEDGREHFEDEQPLSPELVEGKESEELEDADIAASELAERRAFDRRGRLARFASAVFSARNLGAQSQASVAATTTFRNSGGNSANATTGENGGGGSRSKLFGRQGSSGAAHATGEEGANGPTQPSQSQILNSNSVGSPRRVTTNASSKESRHHQSTSMLAVSGLTGRSSGGGGGTTVSAVPFEIRFQQSVTPMALRRSATMRGPSTSDSPKTKQLQLQGDGAARRFVRRRSSEDMPPDGPGNERASDDKRVFRFSARPSAAADTQPHPSDSPHTAQWNRERSPIESGTTAIDTPSVSRLNEAAGPRIPDAHGQATAALAAPTTDEACRLSRPGAGAEASGIDGETTVEDVADSEMAHLHAQFFSHASPSAATSTTAPATQGDLATCTAMALSLVRTVLEDVTNGTGDSVRGVRSKESVVTNLRELKGHLEQIALLGGAVLHGTVPARTEPAAHTTTTTTTKATGNSVGMNGARPAQFRMATKQPSARSVSRASAASDRSLHTPPGQRTSPNAMELHLGKDDWLKTFLNAGTERAGSTPANVIGQAEFIPSNSQLPGNAVPFKSLSRESEPTLETVGADEPRASSSALPSTATGRTGDGGSQMIRIVVKPVGVDAGGDPSTDRPASSSSSSSSRSAGTGRVSEIGIDRRRAALQQSGLLCRQDSFMGEVLWGAKQSRQNLAATSATGSRTSRHRRLVSSPDVKAAKVDEDSVQSEQQQTQQKQKRDRPRRGGGLRKDRSAGREPVGASKTLPSNWKRHAPKLTSSTLSDTSVQALPSVYDSSTASTDDAGPAPAAGTHVNGDANTLAVHEPEHSQRIARL